MSDFDVNAWNAASEDGNFEPSEAPPDGLYEIMVTDFKAFESKAGKAIVVVELRAVGGAANGHEWAIVSGFGSPGAIGVTKSTCSRLGVDVAHPSITGAPDPAAALAALDAAGKAAAVGQWFSVKVERKDDYTNTYIDSKLSPPAAMQPAPVSDVNSDTSGFQHPAPQPVAAGQPASEQPPF